MVITLVGQLLMVNISWLKHSCCLLCPTYNHIIDGYNPYQRDEGALLMGIWPYEDTKLRLSTRLKQTNQQSQRGVYPQEIHVIRGS